MSRPIFLLSAVSLLALASPALAQELRSVDRSATPGAAVPSNSSDIIVTATRRSERLSNVPIAMTALGTTALQNAGAYDVRQMTAVVPSLLVITAISEASATARIRGIGTVGENPGLETSVALFVDGVYRNRTGVGLNDIGEVERVEVLRGPQGTLSGRNSSAGAISIYSKYPSFTFGGYGEASYGNYDAVRLAGAVTGPIIKDLLAFRVDGVVNKRDGFVHDVVNDTDINNRDRAFVRGQLFYRPSSDFSVRLIADYTRRDEICCGGVYIDTREKTDPTPGVPGDFAIAAQNRIVPILQSLGGIFPSDGDPYNRQVAVTPGRAYSNLTTDGGVSARVGWNFGNSQLISITAYREYETASAADLDFSNVDIYARADDGNASRGFKTFSQEARLSGSAFSGRVDWLVGGYFAHETLQVVDNLTFGSQYGAFAACRAVATINPAAALRNAANPGCLSAAGRATLTPAVGPQIIAGIDRLSTLNNLGSLNDVFDQTSRNFAVFTHNMIRLTDTVSLTGGLRYTNESKTLDVAYNNNNTVCPAQQAALRPLLSVPALAELAGGLITLTCVSNSTSALNGVPMQSEIKEGEFTGTGVLSWKASPSTLVYASFARGYKAGGFNLDRSDLSANVFSTPTAASVENLKFDPETVMSYEAGVKYTSGVFTANVAAFRSEFSSFQLNTFTGTNFIVQNIGSCSESLNGADRDNSSTTGACTGDVEAGVVTQGVELEAGYYPNPDFGVSVGYTYAHTQYADNLVGSASGEALNNALFLLPDSQMSNAPRNVVTGSLTWTPDIGSTGLTGLVYVDGRLTSKYNTGSDQFVEKAQDGFFVMNAKVGIQSEQQNWAFEIWGRNLLDEEYTQTGFAAPVQGSGSQAQVQSFGGVGNTLFGAFPRRTQNLWDYRALALLS